MKVVALAGGVGGAKLVDGFAMLNPSPTLTVIVNTGDDFELFGLQICPDLDTVCYNLAGLEEPQTGWGRANESWETYQEVKYLGGPDWFRLGNKDLGTHLERTRRLKSGETLSQITADFCRIWGIIPVIIPMSDEPIPTIVQTDRGALAFQDYFVKLGCEPQVTGFEYQGAEKAHPAPGIIEAINQADLVVICPSNPWVSIEPILAVPGIRRALENQVVMAVSPIIGGKAVKGPVSKMYRELGINPSAAAVAEHYGGLLTGFVMDQEDLDLVPEVEEISKGSFKVFTTGTWMRNRKDRVRVADHVLGFGQQLLKEV
jgi:LPPG:FO 2-phospho-L-lactate transferase